MSGHRTARLALGSVAVVVVVSASACVSSAVCTSDADCAAFGDGSVCVRGERAEGLCTDGDLTPDDVSPPRRDAGPPDQDSGPGDLTIELLLRPSDTVTAGQPVTLEWEAPAAVACSVSAQAFHEDGPHDVADAPTGASGEANVEVTQDTTFTVTCQDAEGASESRSEDVDVTTEGELRTTTTSVNWNASVTLEWEIFGARDCAILDDAGTVLHTILPAELQGGSVSQPATTPRFALRCDGAELDEVALDIASLTGLRASPSALGPEPETVTLEWTHDGPGGCRVFLGGAASTSPDVAGDPGHQVVLDGTTTVDVTCDGHDGELRASLEVPRLITSFTGPTTAIDYLDDVTLAYDTVEGASCTLYDESGAEVANPVPAVGANGRFDLVCSAGGKTATASVEVWVLPEVPRVVGELLPLDPSGAVLSLVVETSPNAVSCELLPSTGTTPPLTAGATVASTKTFTAEVAEDALSGAVGFDARCFADDGRTLATVSAEPLRAYFGDLDGDTLASVGAATLLLGDVMLFNDDTLSTADLTALAGVRQMSGDLFVQGLGGSGFDSFDPLRLERVIGDVTVKENDFLDRLGVDAEVDPAGDKGLAWLVEVHGNILLEDNPGLASAPFGRLTTLSGNLTVRNNGTLDLLSAPVLTEVNSVVIDGNPDLDDSDGLGFAALKRVRDDLIVTQSSIVSFSSYFPALEEVVGAFGVTMNTQMGCAEIEDVFCRFPQDPASISVSGNAESCGWASPPDCPAQP